MWQDDIICAVQLIDKGLEETSLIQSISPDMAGRGVMSVLPHSCRFLKVSMKSETLQDVHTSAYLQSMWGPLLTLALASNSSRHPHSGLGLHLPADVHCLGQQAFL